MASSSVNKSKTKYTQKFRHIWLSDPALKDWITVVESTTGAVAKCKLCLCILSNKYSDLKIHANSKKHQNSTKLILDKKQTKIPFAPKTHLDGAKYAECRIALYLACHNAIANTDHLVPLCKTSFKGIEAEYLQMHRTKCSALISNVLSPHFMQELSDDVGDRPYSLLIDESNDISVIKYLGVSIIYFSIKHSKIISTGLCLGELESANADGIINCLLSILAKYKLKVENMQGLGTDNASVMTGINNGVHKKLQAYNPNLILIRCLCHSVQLAASAATKVLPRNLKFLIRETYDWFSRSAMRQSQYKNLFMTINDGDQPLKIVQACTTRWLSIEPAINRIHSQWLELKTHFEIVRNTEKCYTGELLYQMFCDNFNYAYICFLKPILSDLNRVNKNFEANNADPTKLMDDLLLLLQSLVQKVTTPNSQFQLFQHNIENYIDNHCYLGYLFENQVRTMVKDGFQEEESLRQRCIQFLVTLIKELTNRVPDNVKILKKMSLFSVANVLSHNKQNLTELLTFLKKKNETEIAIIDNQWSKIHLLQWENKTDTTKFWVEVYNYKDAQENVFLKEIANVAISMLTLPHSNAEIERLFSQMNIVKNKLRNRMKLPMLNSILTIRYAMRRINKCCFDFEVPAEMVKKIKTIETYNNFGTEVDDIDFDII